MTNSKSPSTRGNHPFGGLKVFYSGSIRGVPEDNPVLPRKLVEYLIKGGANVLSEHVVASSPKEMEKIRTKKIGRFANKIIDEKQPWFGIRQTDTEWVDKSTHLISLVNGPSHGVGMEIERALLKEERGLSHTPVLCLVREDLFDNLTYMIRGIRQKGFYLRTYTDLESARSIISNFLSGKL